MAEPLRNPMFFPTNITERELWIFNFVRVEYLVGLRPLYLTVAATEAFICTFSAAATALLMIRILRHPPVHMNLTIVAAYYLFIIAISNGARSGQILFESGSIPSRRDSLPDACVILACLRLFAIASLTRFSAVVYIERCLALRHVRDYEHNRRLHISFMIIISDIVISSVFVYLIMSGIIPGYHCALVIIFQYFIIFFAMKNLLRQNEMRLEHLNERSVTRPSVSSGFGKVPKKFFGDSSKDMYTLSLRLQLDENIWCCKQIDHANYVFLSGIVGMTVLICVPQLFSYTRDTIWILMILIMFSNLLIPNCTLACELSIAWSLDKLRPLIFPAFLIARHEAKRQREQRGRVTTLSQISADSDSRYSRETDEYFHQLYAQWN